MTVDLRQRAPPHRVLQSSPQSFEVGPGSKKVLALAPLFPSYRIVSTPELERANPAIRSVVPALGGSAGDSYRYDAVCGLHYSDARGIRYGLETGRITDLLTNSLHAWVDRENIAFDVPETGEGDITVHQFVAFELDPADSGTAKSVPLRWDLRPGDTQRLIVGLIAKRSGILKVKLRLAFGAGDWLETQPAVVYLIAECRTLWDTDPLFKD